jgi:hypothetical protein
MADKKKKIEQWDGKEVEILAETYEEGQPQVGDPVQWRKKLRNRQEMLKYLETGERYWFSKDWYGSERRKTEA